MLRGVELIFLQARYICGRPRIADEGASVSVPLATIAVLCLHGHLPKEATIAGGQTGGAERFAGLCPGRRCLLSVVFGTLGVAEAEPM